MNHAITIGGLLLSVGLLVGFIGFLLGMLMIFAGGMSDAPEDGDKTSKQGCTVVIVAALLFVGCAVKLFA